MQARKTATGVSTGRLLHVPSLSASGASMRSLPKASQALKRPPQPSILRPAKTAKQSGNAVDECSGDSAQCPIRSDKGICVISDLVYFAYVAYGALKCYSAPHSLYSLHAAAPSAQVVPTVGGQGTGKYSPLKIFVL